MRPFVAMRIDPGALHDALVGLPRLAVCPDCKRQVYAPRNLLTLDCPRCGRRIELRPLEMTRAL